MFENPISVAAQGLPRFGLGSILAGLATFWVGMWGSGFTTNVARRSGISYAEL